MIKIVAEKNIPFAKEAFSTIGSVTLLASTEINNASIRDFDALIVRTTVKVNEELLQGSRIQFVGTATIGTDHIDLEYLEDQGIRFSSAPGCNATAVGEYVLNSLTHLLEKQGKRLSDQTLGIIGAGNTGSALQKKAEIAGIRCLPHDPPQEERNGKKGLYPMEELLEKATVLSFHVPYTKFGKYRTESLLSQKILNSMRPGTILINSSRGEVFDEEAVLNYREKIGGLILDVWRKEPNISEQLLQVCDLATPHVAGYSFDGKVRATNMIYQALCDFFQLRPIWNSDQVLGEEAAPKIRIKSRHSSLKDIFHSVYNPEVDDRALRANPDSSNHGDHFRKLRDHYQFRREFQACSVYNSAILSTEHKKILSDLGFQIA